MDKNFSSDKPISNEKEDRFQRYGFSKRIANTIVERESEDCIVIGIYGAWGEGKTSVINFIEAELKAKENIIPIKFNPWRYSDENSLLTQFFQQLSSSLDAKLKTNKEKLGDLIKKYGKSFTPFLGSIGESVENAGEILAGVEVETLKERIGNILKENKSKVVVFIDDIDRLDKTEIHSVFRLVKLTGDFSNTTYILSFDEQMVSAAIGERFGEGNKEAGKNFLEKIIQVPLTIPVAQPEILQKFCFELVEKIVNANNIQLTDEEGNRFGTQFMFNILTMLNTPRLAVRYGNSLSFALPLLAGEVNVVDLMLIEAVKIFYPNYYEFIKENPEYFVNTSSQLFSAGRYNSASLKEHFELLGKTLTKKQRSCIQNLLEALFPKLNEVLHNHAAYDGRILNEWFKQKRISSSKYFNRYFSYAVIKGEVSDIAFQDFLAGIQTQTIQDVGNSIEVLIEQSSPENFIHKLRSIEEDYSWEMGTKLIKAISNISHLFPKKDSFSFGFGFDDPKKQAAIFIYHLIKNHNSKKEQYVIAKELMKEVQPFEFAYDINNWLRRGETPEQKIFSNEQYEELAMELVKRALKEAGNQPVFEKYPNHVNYIFSAWAVQNKKNVTKYINDILKKDGKKVIDLLRAFTPTAYSSAVVGPFKADFTRDYYQSFVSIFDKKVIDKMISKVYKDKEINAEEVQWVTMGDKVQSDINIARQFRHWLQQELITIETTTN